MTGWGVLGSALAPGLWAAGVFGWSSLSRPRRSGGTVMSASCGPVRGCDRQAATRVRRRSGRRWLPGFRPPGVGVWLIVGSIRVGSTTLLDPPAGPRILCLRMLRTPVDNGDSRRGSVGGGCLTPPTSTTRPTGSHPCPQRMTPRTAWALCLREVIESARARSRVRRDPARNRSSPRPRSG